MALTRIPYPNTNSATTTYAFDFDVLSTADINVEIDNVQIFQNDLNYPWEPDDEANPGAIVFTGSVGQRPNGNLLVIYRDTDRTALYKTFDNAPLNSTDLNKSFEKILFIQQEAFDYIDETVDLIGEGGGANVPTPLSEEDDFFLVSQNEAWEKRSPAYVKSILDLDFASNLEVDTLTANTSVSSLSVSATSGTIGTLEVSNLSGAINILDDGQDYTRITNNADGPLILNGNSVVFKIGDEEKFRIYDPPVANSVSILHNYGDSLPSYFDTQRNVGIALSGTGRVIATNTIKGYGVVSDTTGTITLSDNFGVSAVTRNGAGDYTLDLDTDVFGTGQQDKLIYVLSVTQTALGSQVYRPVVASTSTDKFTVKIYIDPLGASTTDLDFRFKIY